MNQSADQDPATRVLVDILETCRGRIVAFDLDSTLLDNRPRSATIMREFSQHIGEPRLAAAAPEHWVDWSTHRAMRNIGLTADTASALLDAHEVFWAERFFTSEYCAYDTDISGAITFVNAVHDAGGMVIYLTGRPEAMRDGTLRSLDALGFPRPGSGNTELRTRTADFASDDDFKRSAISALSDHTPVVAAFDNEPTHINLYRTLQPDAHCIHLDTDHSGRSVTLLEGIVSLRNFSMTPNELPRARS